MKFATFAILMFASSLASASAPFDDTARAAVRAELQALIDEGYYPGASILLIHRGETVMREALGLSDIETKRPFSVDDLCWLASTGKIFTATLMASLVEDGLLSFDDAVEKTFPEFGAIALRTGGKPARPVLLRHAMSHTSGLPGNAWIEQNGIRQDDPELRGYFFPETPRHFIEGCLKIGLVAEPGARMLYGRPMDLCACVAEKVTGKPFTRLMEERVFAPLGLKNTTIRPDAEALKRLVPLYQSSERGVFRPDNFGLEVAERQNKLLSTAGGGVYATLDDVGVLMRLHLNRGRHEGRQLWKPETLARLYEPQPGTDGKYALAFQVMKSTLNGASTLYNHPGYSGPVAWFDFERDLAGVILMQSNTTDRGKHHQRVFNVIHRFIPARSDGAAE